MWFFLKKAEYINLSLYFIFLYSNITKLILNINIIHHPKMNNDFNFVPVPTPIKVDPQYSLNGRFMVRPRTLTHDEIKWLNDDEMLILKFGGGFWTQNKSSFWNKIDLNIKANASDRVPLYMYSLEGDPLESEKFKQPPNASLFGDGPEFNAQKQLIWDPIKSNEVFFKFTDIIKLLTGESQFFFTQSDIYTPTEPVAMTHRAQHQIVVSPPSLVHSIVNELKTKNQAEIHRTMVSKQDFDKFWTNLFASHGNSQPADTRASLESYVKRPEFKSSPNWQVLICFLIMGDPVIRNANTSTMVRQ